MVTVVFMVVLMAVVMAVFVGGVDPFGPDIHIEADLDLLSSSSPYPDAHPGTECCCSSSLITRCQFFCQVPVIPPGTSYPNRYLLSYWVPVIQLGTSITLGTNHPTSTMLLY